MLGFMVPVIGKLDPELGSRPSTSWLSVDVPTQMPSVSLAAGDLPLHAIAAARVAFDVFAIITIVLYSRLPRFPRELNPLS